ncbi:hypothetical protein BCIN_12g01710 [Botrytis cinerea B05.10]|uniref:Uncharacterized protein n=1 Tax=Botryotinia fuckeliana (strain B05.10) TaxID=332648 RepID=A0A384JYD5_BOTFB|nr:hypothetical protein BCIN_12g01710 [Botrytis cinerea B05.10]ATZ55590.1 hypothetical protein BCIN_12g01710 [Botrytis cinerea B05.10]
MVVLNNGKGNGSAEPAIQDIAEIQDHLEDTHIADTNQGSIPGSTKAHSSRTPSKAPPKTPPNSPLNSPSHTPSNTTANTTATTAEVFLSTIPSPIPNPADWTSDLPDSDHVQFFKNTNWAATHLGPLESWGLALRLHTFTTFADSRPACLYWGPERVAIYNQNFIQMSGKTHPALMGKPFELAFPEIWTDIKGVFMHAETTKLAADVNEIPLMVERSGFKEETYFTGSFNPVRREDGAVGGFYNSVVRMFEADLMSHDISIKTIAQPSFDTNNIDLVMFDSSRVNQILINLLTNAIKFTRGEPRRRITVTYGATLVEPEKNFSKDFHWAQCGNEVEDLTLNPEWGSGEPVFLTCAVTDTGVGMHADEIPRLFTRFEQANSKTSIKYGGSGLGLFISQKLAEKQGGRIGLSSKLGQGSTFGFYVKVRRSVKQPKDTRPKLAPVSFDGSYYDGSKSMHVLLVEDNLVNQKILEKQLKKAGCIVYVANHGLEALETLRQCSCWHEPVKDAKKLDIILMDWEMPVMDGLTCSREIRALQQSGKILRHLEIIAITANAREEQVQLALHNGINFVMSKPFIVSSLLSKMRERLSGIDNGTIFQ